MQNEIVKLQSELEKANQRADNAEAAAEKFKKDLNKLQEKNTALDTKLTVTKKELVQCIDARPLYLSHGLASSLQQPFEF